MTYADKIRLLRETIIKASREPEIMRLALSFSGSGGDVIGNVYSFVKSNIRYEKEPFGCDNFQYPTYTLRVRFGDCEDHTMLIGSILRANGHMVGFKVAKVSDGYHVYPVVYRDGRWIALDTTIPEPMGCEVSGEWKKLYIV